MGISASGAPIASAAASQPEPSTTTASKPSAPARRFRVAALAAARAKGSAEGAATSFMAPIISQFAVRVRWPVTVRVIVP